MPEYTLPPEAYIEGNIPYLKAKYAAGFITYEELETGLDSVLRGGPINVPKGKTSHLRYVKDVRILVSERAS